MDAVKFIEERYRICNSNICSSECPFWRDNLSIPDLGCADFIRMFPAEAVSIVEQWSREHPVMTNAQKFEEVFGEKPDRSIGGRLCPPIALRKSKDCNINCFECKQWWDEPYKEPEGKGVSL